MGDALILLGFIVCVLWAALPGLMFHCCCGHHIVHHRLGGGGCKKCKEGRRC